jgi:predicted site-specific integrase-resolvase
MKIKKLYSVQQYATLHGVTPQAVRVWCNEGKLEHERTPGNHRRIVVREEPQEEVVCYCRVSSHKQKDDLERQVNFMKGLYPNARIIKDIGSGLNFKRKGLKTVLDTSMSGAIQTVIVAHRDRIGRFGFDLIKWIVEKNGGKLVVLDKTEHSPEQELTKDLLSILHVFSYRLHGLRSYKSKINKALSKQTTKENI